MLNWYETNLNNLLKRQPELAGAFEGLLFEGFEVQGPEGRARLEGGPRGHFGLSHCSSGGIWRRLTSALDPAAEDAALIDRLSLSPADDFLVLGLGLAYHLEELHHRLAPESRLWVLESRPELAALALGQRDLRHLWQRPGFRLFLGPFPRTGPWLAADKPPAKRLVRPATARYFLSEYPGGKSRPTGARDFTETRLLFFHSGYYLNREVVQAAEELGLEVRLWNFDPIRDSEGDRLSAAYRNLLALIKDFRPHLALTINHLGFDREGLLDGLLSHLKLPVASWFVDSPWFILGERLRKTRPSEWLTLFSWDRDYLEPLKKLGFPRVHFLPLASSEIFFKPAPPAPGFLRQLAFVGDSLTQATAKYLGKLRLGAECLPLIDERAQAFLGTADLWPGRDESLTLASRLKLPPAEENLVNLAALITWRASRQARLEVLRRLAGEDLTVAGDPHWAELLPGPASRLTPGPDYYRELSAFYGRSAVNLNITSAQMKNGLNQRVFDVAASRSFLLTDYRTQILEMYEPEKEVILYKSPEEALSLARWYGDRPEIRAQVAEAAWRRTQKQHLYRFRLAELLTIMSRELS